MYVCMYACMHVYGCMYMYLYVYYIYIYMWVSECMYVNKYIHMCIYTYIYLRQDIPLPCLNDADNQCVYVCVCTNPHNPHYIYIYIYIYICMYICMCIGAACM
jgi:hypothetical protein